MARAAPPDVVLLDLKLPDLDGVDVLRRLRSDPLTRSIPVVLVSAAGDGHVEAALAEGADDLVAKPFDLDDLCSRVALWLWRSARRARPRRLVLAPTLAVAPV
jgi:CheY-like chemotaxis protein